MTKCVADVQIDITVEFDDDGESSLLDQAIEAAQECMTIQMQHQADMRVVGGVREA